MPRRFGILVAASLAAAVSVAPSQRAFSGQKHCRVVCQPVATCQPTACQTTGPVPTCCQPAAATIASTSSPIELCAHTQPAPRRLTPQPDALNINPTLSTTICAIYMWADWGSYQSYYAINCSTRDPQNLNGNNLAPLPGNCDNPNGACVNTGSSVTPTASGASSTLRSGAFSQKGIKLTRKGNAGSEPINPASPQKTGTHALKERKQIGQPIYVKFARVPGSSEFVIVELKRFFVKGVGAAGQEHAGTFAVGLEIDQVPAGKTVKELSRNHVLVLDDHVARLEIGNVNYDVVAASKLTP